jgi:hypothetical protein
VVERALVRPVRPFKVKVSLLIERGRTRSRSTSSTTHHFHRGLLVPFRAPTFSVRILVDLPTRNIRLIDQTLSTSLVLSLLEGLCGARYGAEVYQGCHGLVLIRGASAVRRTPLGIDSGARVLRACRVTSRDQNDQNVE